MYNNRLDIDIRTDLYIYIYMLNMGVPSDVMVAVYSSVVGFFTCAAAGQFFKRATQPAGSCLTLDCKIVKRYLLT